jgi:hypothetical protein
LEGELQQLKRGGWKKSEKEDKKELLYEHIIKQKNKEIQEMAKEKQKLSVKTD